MKIQCVLVLSRKKTLTARVLSVAEVFTEDPGPVRVRVYVLKGQPGPGE